MKIQSGIGLVNLPRYFGILTLMLGECILREGKIIRRMQ